MRNYTGSFTTPVVIIVLAAIAVIAIGVWAVLGADICLTKEQAKARWPGQWLYWHTAQHCWDNQRGGKTAQNKAMPVAVKSSIDGNGVLGHHSRQPIAVEKGPTIYYPSLMTGGGTSNDMLTPHIASSWSPITDFDTDPPPFLPWQRTSGLFTR